MFAVRSSLLLLSPLVACGLLSGCERARHELHPNQLWRLNRGPAVGQIDSNFSIPDDEATARSDELRQLLRGASQTTPVDPWLAVE